MAFYTRENFYPDASLGYLLRVCNQVSLANLDRALDQEGLTGIQWSALISIHFGRGVTCAGLARDLAHDTGAMTRLIDTLEQRGLVARERDAADRRIINLSLTPLGDQVAMACRDDVITAWNAWLVDWTAPEIEMLIAQLLKLRRTLESTPACAA